MPLNERSVGCGYVWATRDFSIADFHVSWREESGILPFSWEIKLSPLKESPHIDFFSLFGTTQLSTLQFTLAFNHL